MASLLSKFMPPTTGEEAFNFALPNHASIFKKQSNKSPCRLEGVKDLEEQGMGVAQLDVTDIASIHAAVELIVTTEGRIDLLVCNAGICWLYSLLLRSFLQAGNRQLLGFAGMAAPGWLAEMDYKNVERIFNVNLHGVFRVAQVCFLHSARVTHFKLFEEHVGPVLTLWLMSQPVARHMMARRSGKIAVMSSVNASIASPFNGPYCVRPLLERAACYFLLARRDLEPDALGIAGHQSSSVHHGRRPADGGGAFWRQGRHHSAWLGPQ